MAIRYITVATINANMGIDRIDYFDEEEQAITFIKMCKDMDNTYGDINRYEAYKGISEKPFYVA